MSRVTTMRRNYEILSVAYLKCRLSTPFTAEYKTLRLFLTARKKKIGYHSWVTRDLFRFVGRTVENVWKTFLREIIRVVPKSNGIVYYPIHVIWVECRISSWSHLSSDVRFFRCPKRRQDLLCVCVSNYFAGHVGPSEQVLKCFFSAKRFLVSRTVCSAYLWPRF